MCRTAEYSSSSPTKPFLSPAHILVRLPVSVPADNFYSACTISRLVMELAAMLEGLTFGAVLDMVTDRCTTACLLVFRASAWPR